MWFLFGWKRRIFKLRKDWDRSREKSLKKGGLYKRVAFPKLDQTEQNLRILEERRVTRIERARLAKEIEISLSEIKAILGMKLPELQNYLKKTKPV